MLQRYRKRESSHIVAIQLKLETDGFTYNKWGAIQSCKPGDWIVSNEGDVYTVDQESFDRTYEPVGAGIYLKTTPVWAKVAEKAGVIETKEGASHYETGAYLVFNDPEGEDGYTVDATRFEEMYELDHQT